MIWKLVVVKKLRKLRDWHLKFEGFESEMSSLFSFSSFRCVAKKIYGFILHNYE